MNRRTFLVSGLEGLALCLASPLSLSAQNTREKLGAYPVVKVTAARVVTPEMQHAYDQFSKINLTGRKYGEWVKGWDEVTAAVADKFFGNDDRTTGSIEAYNLKEQEKIGKTTFKDGKLYIPVVGFNPEREFSGIVTPTNNPLDWIMAGRKGETRRRLTNGYLEGVLGYLEEGLSSSHDMFGSVNDSTGLIVLEYDEHQQNGPLVVSAFYRPLDKKDGKILTLEKILPCQYNLRAREVSESMVQKDL